MYLQEGGQAALVVRVVEVHLVREVLVVAVLEFLRIRRVWRRIVKWINFVSG